MKQRPRHKQIEAIFLEAAETTDPAEREAILARACGDDAVLRAHVERLLTADAANAADASIGQSVAEFPAEPAPRQIGAYVVHAIAGEGGMGAVYEATHEPTGRRAAVKLVRAGISSLRGRERMRIEAETLGRLNSPNVAQVYDAGIADVTFDDGTHAHRPFIAMEFVDGVSITEYDAAHPMSLDGRLALFEQVARAIHHAHQRGVIHRDLKPSNILVTADGVPKVVDFGIARLVDLATEGITISGQVLGTARYMSPEQAGGDANRVDTRTDVYALGAILYELLAKRPIVDVGTGSSLGALLRVLNTVPPRLGTLQPKTPRDVDAIVHKAIERDPDHRYGSAQMLADDLEHFRTGREVTARAPGAIERTVRLIRRNRSISAAAAVAVAAIIGGSAVSLWQARAAIRQEQATARALGEAQASLAYLTDLLASCTPERDGRNARVLDVAVKAAADIEGRFKDRPLVLSEVRLALGRTFLALGKGQDALRALEAAHQQRLEVLGPDDVRTVEAEAALDEAALNVGKTAVQNRDFERPREWFEAHLGPTDRRTLRAQLTAAEARAVLKRGPDPFALVQATASAFERTYGPDDQDTLDAKTTLAFWLLDRRDDPDAVIQLLTPMIALETRTFGANNARTLHCIWLLAGACNVTGDNARAIALLEPAMPAFDEVYGEDHPEAVLAQRSLAVAYLSAGRNDRAEAALQRAIAGSAVAFGEADGRTQSIRIRLAQWWTDVGRLDEAEPLARTVLDQEMLAPLAAAHYGLAMDAQGRILLARQRPTEAAIRFRGAIAVFAADRWDRTRADAVEGLGVCMQQLGQPADAAVCFADAAESYAHRMGEQHPNTRRARAELDAARAAIDPEHATPTLVAPIGSDLGDNTAVWQVQLARIALQEGQRDVAATWLQRAADRNSKLDPPDAATAATIQELQNAAGSIQPQRNGR